MPSRESSFDGIEIKANQPALVDDGRDLPSPVRAPSPSTDSSCGSVNSQQPGGKPRFSFGGGGSWTSWLWRPSSTQPTSVQEKREPSEDDNIRKWQKQARRKMDLTLLPLMCAIILLQYLDKAILSYAALLGLVTDLKLVSNEYSWAASIYYFGMLAGLPIWWALLQSLQVDTVVGYAVMIWGAVAMCHAACHNYAGILAARFFLGVFEAAVVPSFIIIIAKNYTKKQTISRTAIWYSFNGVALMIGGGMSYSLLQHSSTARGALAIWRQLYLILGGITIAVGILARWVVPMDPFKSRFYTHEQKRALPMEEGRLVTHMEETDVFDWGRCFKQAVEAFCDPRLYIIFLGLTLGSIPNGGVTAYSLQLIAGFGFPRAQALLLTLAPGGAQIVSVLTFIAVALLTRSRAVAGIILLVIAIVGAAVMYEPNLGEGAHMAGYVLLNFGSPAVVALYSFNSAAVASKGKRVVFAIVAQVAYAAGNIIGPLTFLAEETPVYRTAKIIIIATLCGAALSLALILGIHMYWNQQRDRKIKQQLQQERRKPPMHLMPVLENAVNKAKGSDPRTAWEIVEDAQQAWMVAADDREPEPLDIICDEQGLCERHNRRIWDQILKRPMWDYEPSDFENPDWRYVY